MTTAELYNMWMTRLKDAESWNEQMLQESEPFREAYSGRFPIPYPEEDEEAQVYVNRIHRVVMQWKGSLYAQDPRIFLEQPEYGTPQTRTKLNLNQAIYNAELRRVGFEDPMRRAIQTAFLDGWSILKQGFHAEWEYEADDVEQQTSDATAETEAFKLMDPQFFPERVLIEEDHAEHLEHHMRQMANLKTQAMALLQQIKPQMDQGIPVGPAAKQEVEAISSTVQAIQQHIQMHEAMESRIRKEGLFPTNTRIKLENCWVDYVSNTNFLWDLHATGPHDWRWVAERMIHPLEKWKKHKRFKHKSEMISDYTSPKPGSTEEGPGMWQGRAVRSETLEAHGERPEKDPDALAGVWKIWDLEYRKVYYLHEPLHDKFLLVDDWPHEYLRSPPFSMLYFELEEKKFRPIPQAKYIWSQQLELNRYRTKAGIITRRANRISLADERIDEEQLEQIRQGPDGSVIKASVPPGGSLQGLVSPIDWGNVPFDVYQLGAQADNDMQIDTGLGGVNLGSGEKAKTATAAQVQKESVGVTLDDKLRMVELFTINNLAHLRDLMRQYYTQGRNVEIVGEDGEKVMKSWTGRDLKAFRIRVEMGSSMKQERDILRMQWLQLLQAVSPIQGVNLLWVVERILEHYDVRNPAEAFFQMGTAQASPMQQGMGPGQGQNQQSLPGGGQGQQSGGVAAQPAQDMAKVGV